jgi:hypothetical protein
MDNNKNIITTKIKLSCIRIVSDGETELQAPNTGGIIVSLTVKGVTCRRMQAFYAINLPCSITG